MPVVWLIMLEIILDLGENRTLWNLEHLWVLGLHLGVADALANLLDALVQLLQVDLDGVAAVDEFGDDRALHAAVARLDLHVLLEVRGERRVAD